MSKKAQKTGTLADLVRSTLATVRLRFMSSSRNTARKRYGAMMEGGRTQRGPTGDVLRDEYSTSRC